LKPRPSKSALRALVRAARLARRRAVAPYSHFKVGAALSIAGGAFVTGCNIENASYGLTLCAERVALFKAVSEGLRGFGAIAVVSGAKQLTPPCGACRQVLWEFCGDIQVHLENLAGESMDLTLKELLPLPFDRQSL